MPGIINTFYNAEPTAGLLQIAGGSSVESALNTPAITQEMQPYNTLTKPDWLWWGFPWFGPKDEGVTEEEKPKGSEREEIPVERGGVGHLDYFWTLVFLGAAAYLATRFKKGGA